MNKDSDKVFFRYIVISVVLLTVVLCPFEKTEAASSVNRIGFISNVIDELTAGNIPDSKITVKKSGNSLMVNGEKIKKSYVNKYKKKYGISQKYAIKLLAAEKLGIITGSDLKQLKKKLTLAGAAGILVRTEELLYGEYLSDDDIENVLINRIEDINQIKSMEKRVNVAKLYMYGYVQGSSKGQYSHARLLYPNRKLKKKEISALISRITDKNSRIKLSPDFQVLRKPGKIKNAGYYSYILDSFPDDFYETGFNGMTSDDFFITGKGLGADDLKTRMSRKNFSFVFPFELAMFNALKYPGPEFPYNSDIFLDCYRNSEIAGELVESSVEFYTFALNIDYRTIGNDKKWKAVMGKYLSKEEIEDYIKHCKENKTIIECDIVASDPSSVYWYNGDYNCKCYAHFRVISDYPLENGYTKGSDQEKYGYLYPVKRGYELGTLFTRSVLGELYMGYKMGEWVDFYFNTSGVADEYGSLNCSNTSRSIMIDYSGLYPWLYKLPY